MVMDEVEKECGFYKKVIALKSWNRTWAWLNSIDRLEMQKKLFYLLSSNISQQDEVLSKKECQMELCSGRL